MSEPNVTTAAEAESILLGSGDLYVTDFTDGSDIPADSEIETEENRLGQVSGGATIEYKPTFYTAKDDFGRVEKTIITDEEATLKSGICTFTGNKLKKLASTARVSEANGKRILKIGGIGNDNGKKYIIRFTHKDEVDGDVRVTVVGKNEAGFSLAFAKDKETVIDAEFKAKPMDTEGTLIMYEEEIKTSSENASNEEVTTTSSDNVSDTEGDATA